MKFDIWKFFETLSKNFASFIGIWQEYRAIYLKTDIQFWAYLAQFFLEKKLFQAKVVKRSKHTFYAQYRIFWKPYRLCDKVEIIVEQGRPHLTIRRMRIACWIAKARNTHSEYVILIAFPLQRRLHERASMLRYCTLLALLYRVSHSLPNPAFL